MSEQNRNKSSARRKLLKSVVAGGGILATGRLLPESWSRPVVQAVMLPAHAQTSPPAGITGGFGPATSVGGMNERGRSIMDFFVQPARAQTGGAVVGNVFFTASWTVRENDAEICGNASHLNSVTSLSGTVGRTGNSLDDFNQPVDGVTLSFTNQQVDGGGISLTASTDEPGSPSDSFVAPAGGGCGGAESNSSSPYPDDEREEIA